MDATLTAPLMAGSDEEAQIALEEESITEGIARYYKLRQEAIDRGSGASLKPAERLVLYWLDPLVGHVKREHRAIRAGKAGPKRGVYGPFLLQLEPEILAFITLNQVISLCLQYPLGSKLQGTTYAVGRAVIAEINYRLIRERDRKNSAERRKARKEISDEAWKELRHEHFRESFEALERRIRRMDARAINWWANKTLDNARVNQQVCHEIGGFLLWHLVNTAVLPPEDEDSEEVAGLVVFNKTIRNRLSAYVKLTDAAMQVISEGDVSRQMLRPRYGPMVVRPYRWEEHQVGGYVRLRPPLILKARRIHYEALEAADLSRWYRGLNAVNAPSWRVNRRILSLVEEVWNRGGDDRLGVPAKKNPEMPPKVEDGNHRAIAQNKRDREKVWKMIHQTLPSARQSFLHMLHQAERLRDEPAIYFPHTADFRGRLYPLPQPLNHQGPDIARGLLEWGTGIKSDSPRWRCIHAANCWGFDKATYDERVAWVGEHMGKIVAATDDPYSDEWWRQADSPWQFLAACFAVRFGGEYAAHLPIHRDGTCNGLQHYAAIGRDRRGAEAVNLTPMERPSDVYRDVAEAIEPMVRRDAAAGKKSAMMIQSLINRKVTKRTVMTKVYGVTMVGAREQVATALQEAGMARNDSWAASKYLSTLVLEAVDKVCEAAGSVMRWLQSVARLAVHETNAPLRWTTPLGFPVVQAYYQDDRRQLKTYGYRMWLMVPDDSLGVRTTKSISGMPPNWVHSIDATHMMMTALACEQEGICFAAVHDSFWTHEATVERMGRIAAEQFVSLHEQDLLGSLRSELATQSGVELPEPPEPGNFDLSKVLESEYLFS